MNLPQIPEGEHNYRNIVENHILNVLRNDYNQFFTIQKYFNTANEQIYKDVSNRLKSGVPAWLFRTRRETTQDAHPDEQSDWKSCSIEVITAVPVAIEKNVPNVDRYAYVMTYLLREVLRQNKVKIPNNGYRPFIAEGNKDIFRDDKVDILLSEFNVNYMVI